VDSFRTTVLKRFVSWIRFVTQFSKDSFRGFVSWIRFVTQFSKDSFCGFVSWIRFVTQFSKDSFRGFVSWRNFQKIRFVDSICKTKNLKRFDSFRFGRIRIRIPHPYFWCCGKTRTPIPCLNLPCSFFYFYKEIITLFKFNLSFYLFNNHDRTHLKCTSKSVWVLSEFSWRYKKMSRFNKNKILRTTIWQSWKFFSNFFQIPSSII
jgi:hypothetical protein